MLVAVVLIGMYPWDKLNVNEPLSLAMTAVNLDWAAGIVAFGSVVAHTAVLLVFQLGQPRISMPCRATGYCPRPWRGRIARFRTPHVATILTGPLRGRRFRHGESR